MANYIRRQERTLPSVKKHGLSAFLFLAIVLLLGYIWSNFHKSRSAGRVEASSEIILPEAAIPDAASTQAALPDLLASDNIPLDENPTETLEMIGAPADQAAPTTGPRPPTGAEAADTDTNPKTIMIDGSPVPGTQVTLNRSKPLIRAPIQGLTRTSPFGKVPHPAPDGRKAISSYAMPFTPKPEITYVALVVGGLGINQVVTRRAISELPGEVTLAFAAETPNLQNWINQARARGHEVMIELPMESDDFNPIEPGAAYTLMANGPDSTNIRNLDYLLSRAEGYFAVTNYGGDRLVKNAKSLSPVLSHIGAAGLGFLYDGSDPTAGVDTVLRNGELTSVTAQMLLDADRQDRGSVRAIVSTLSPIGAAKIPIGMGFSYPSTVDGIKDWLQSKPETTDLAPVSYAITQNQ